MCMKFGAHLSVAGGFEKALERAEAIGANALDIFSGSPRSFNVPKIEAGVAKAFKERAAKLKISPIYFHASYLLNLASEEPGGDLSVKMLIGEFAIASACGIKGSVVHIGSFKDAQGEQKKRQFDLVVERIKTILSKTPKDTLFIIENAGTRKIGQTMEEIGEIVKAVKDARLKVCLDTCHLHAAGYDLSTKEKLDAFLKQFDKLVGLERLECFHINDSRDPFGSLRDRHNNIGEGQIPKSVFKLLLNHPKTREIPFIIETPGFDDTGPDKKNLDILKAMVE